MFPAASRRWAFFFYDGCLFCANCQPQNYGAQVPKGFSVRIFKAPALSGFPYGGEPKFDVGYRPKPPMATWQKASWTSCPTKNEQSLRDAPARASRAFGEAINSDHNDYQNDGQPPNYSIYPCVQDDTYVYERSLCSKSDTYTETDVTSDVTFSPSCLSTALSNDSTTTLHSTINTESTVDEPATKTSSSPSLLAQHPFRIKFPGVGRTLSSGISTRDTDDLVVRPSTPAPRARASTLGPDRDSSLNSATSLRSHTPLNPPFSHRSEASNNFYPQSTLRSNTTTEQPTYSSQAARTRASSFLNGTSRDIVEHNAARRSSRDDANGQEPRTLSMVAEAGFSDSFSSTIPPDIHSAAATRGSSPPRPSRSSTPAPESRYRQVGYALAQAVSEESNNPPALRISTAAQLRREADNLAASIAMLSTANGTRDDRTDLPYTSQRRRSEGSSGAQPPSSIRTAYESETHPTMSSQRDNSSTSAPAEQIALSSRASPIDRRKRSASQTGFRGSEVVNGERGPRFPSGLVDPSGHGELGFASSTPSTRDTRNSPTDIHQSRQNGNDYVPSSAFPISDASVYNRQGRAPQTNSQIEIQPSRRTTPPMDGDPMLPPSRDLHSASTTTGRTTPFPHSHVRREPNGRAASSVPAVPSSNVEIGYQVPSRPRQNSDERSHHIPSTTQHPPTSASNVYPGEEDTFAYSGPTFAPEPYRAVTPVPGMQASSSLNMSN